MIPGSYDERNVINKYMDMLGIRACYLNQFNGFSIAEQINLSKNFSNKVSAPLAIARLLDCINNFHCKIPFWSNISPT